MAIIYDRGIYHTSKIKNKGLSCPLLSAYNHIAVFFRWAHLKGILKDTVYDKEPRFIDGVEGRLDLRGVIADSNYFGGAITSDHFKKQFIEFVTDFYTFEGVGYPGCVDHLAKSFFGEERYGSVEFRGEAYLFVPYDEEYYNKLSQYIEGRWKMKMGSQIEKTSCGLQDEVSTCDNKTKKVMENGIKAILFKPEHGEVGLTSSKIGGLPYWPKDCSYPVDSDGKNLILLAQVNMRDISFDRLPSEGILQFFVARNDDMGLFDKNGYKVIFHSNIDSDITEEDVRSRGIRSNVDMKDEEDGWFATDDCYPISFSIGESYNMLELEADDSMNENELAPYNNMFGYPYFTQDDPRTTDSMLKKYDTLLFQLDSIYSDGFNIMIGDAGIINFFINSDELRKLNFEDVLYNWDCC
ncbi:YwqG family protein [Butyrivibrio sp. MC2013]|uniref:YwqG family protein n=1 Tax=Butyrivibrio sp. MC2013 TaxID=1280686 RepID=UPI000422A77E|nr:DUF1963 domain-containing protein [Butyrivibrio sp. MC2013]